MKPAWQGAGRHGGNVALSALSPTHGLAPSGALHPASPLPFLTSLNLLPAARLTLTCVARAGPWCCVALFCEGLAVGDKMIRLLLGEYQH